MDTLHKWSKGDIEWIYFSDKLQWSVIGHGRSFNPWFYQLCAKYVMVMRVSMGSAVVSETRYETFKNQEQTSEIAAKDRIRDLKLRNHVFY